jgi:site-specific recombinase XerD
VSYAGLHPDIYGTHSLRRSRPAYVYAKTRNLRACQLMLGHVSISTTQRYLGIEYAEALELARQYPL